MSSVPHSEQQYKYMAHFSPYGPKQSHIVPRLSPRQQEDNNSVMSVHLIELRVGSWSTPPGTEMVLRIFPGHRRMDVELSTIDMGLYKISWDFSGITKNMSSLNLTEAEVLGKVEMVLANEPLKYRGTMVSYPHREILWSPENDVTPAPYGVAVVLIGRKESLLDSYRYLISHDVSVKHAYQHPSHSYPLHPLSNSTQIHSPHSSHPHHSSSSSHRPSSHSHPHSHPHAHPHSHGHPHPSHPHSHHPYSHPSQSPSHSHPHHPHSHSPVTYTFSSPHPQQSMTGSLHYQPYPAQPVSNEELNAARFKPAEFNAKRLRVGSWEKKSYFAGDLKVKFLYVKKRMVWEILDVFGLTKIEDITSLAVQQTPSEVCMVVDVAKLPFFYHGYPQKMKNTRWEHTSDMTGGQASVCRTHVLYLPKNALNSHMDKLVQSDSHMRNVTTYTATHSSPSSSSTPPNFSSGASTQFTQTFTPANMTAHLKSAAHQPHGNPSSLLTEAAPARVSCKCTNGCGKSCPCTKDTLWCDPSCGCRGGSGKWSNNACGNPTNLKLSPCARNTLLEPQTPSSPSSPPSPVSLSSSTSSTSSTSSSSSYSSSCSSKRPHTHASAQNADPNKLFKLPCKCGSATLSDLVAEHECTECGAQFFYSFCFQTVVPVGAIWHCEVCGTCRDSREFHCDTCGKCSYASPNNACRNCATSSSRGSWDRTDCLIM